MSKEKTECVSHNDMITRVAGNDEPQEQASHRNSGASDGSPEWESFKAGTRHLNTVENLPEMFGFDNGWKQSELVLATFNDGRQEELYCGQNWNEYEACWYVPLPDENGLPTRLATFGIVNWEPLSEGVLVG